MADLKVKLHPKQLEVFNDNHRFKIVAAGRRFGKSRLAAWMLIIEALKSKDKDVFYVAPTFQQAKDIMWALLKDIGHEVIKAAHENTAVLTLINGRKIYLKGSDRPDTLRGVGLAYVVLDEYADMKPQVFEQIIRPRCLMSRVVRCLLEHQRVVIIFMKCLSLLKRSKTKRGKRFITHPLTIH